MVYFKITDRYDMTSSVYRAHTAIMEQTGETMKRDIVLVCLKLNVPVNNFSVILGQSHRFLGISSTFQRVGKCILLKDTTGDPSGARTPPPRPLDPESEVLTTRPPRPQHILWYRRSYFIGSMIIICLLL